jgi:hypothetical protein
LKGIGILKPMFYYFVTLLHSLSLISSSRLTYPISFVVKQNLGVLNIVGIELG